MLSFFFFKEEDALRELGGPGGPGEGKKSRMRRGRPAGYPKGLVNGKKVRGAGEARSFWVARTPAEMVDHVEIIRSNSANRSGDAMAGTINIVLRDAYVFDGSYLRIGATRWFDGEVNPTFGAVTSGDFLGGRILAGSNVQDRSRAKTTRSDSHPHHPPDDMPSLPAQETATKPI